MSRNDPQAEEQHRALRARRLQAWRQFLENAFARNGPKYQPPSCATWTPGGRDRHEDFKLAFEVRKEAWIEAYKRKVIDLLDRELKHRQQNFGFLKQDLQVLFTGLTIIGTVLTVFGGLKWLPVVVPAILVPGAVLLLILLLAPGDGTIRTRYPVDAFGEVMKINDVDLESVVRLCNRNCRTQLDLQRTRFSLTVLIVVILAAAGIMAGYALTTRSAVGLQGSLAVAGVVLVVFVLLEWRIRKAKAQMQALEEYVPSELLPGAAASPST